MKNRRPVALFALCLATLLLSAPAAAETPPAELARRAARQARSVHLWYRPMVRHAQAVAGSVTVRETFTNSYYMVLGFDNGYCGIQDLGARRILLFSVWDPGDPFDSAAHPDQVDHAVRAKLLYSGEGVRDSRFGGEGTGVKTILEYPWELDRPVNLRVECAPEGTNRVAYTAYLDRGGTDGWWRVATISTFRGRKSVGLDGVYSFVEDFGRNGVSARQIRRAEFTGLRSRAAGATNWVPAAAACFTGDETPVLNIDAGPVPGGAFLQTGGATTNSHVRLNGWFPLGVGPLRNHE